MIRADRETPTAGELGRQAVEQLGLRKDATEDIKDMLRRAGLKSGPL